MPILKLSNTVLGPMTLGFGEETDIDDCIATDLTKATSMTLCLIADYDNEATAGITVTAFPSFDGVTWDTQPWVINGAVWSWEPPFTSEDGHVVVHYEQLPITPKYIRFVLKNQDAAKAATGVQLIVIKQEAG